MASFSLQAQDVAGQIEQAIESNNVKTLAKFFDERIEININGESQDYSQQQAQVVLNKFFNDFEATDFKLIDKGVEANHSRYYIGEMKSESEVYSVYVHQKRINDNDYIQEIKFEKKTN